MPNAWDALGVADQAIFVLTQAKDIRFIEDASNLTLTNLDIVWNQSGRP